MERATGIEPASEAWEASILPMNYARVTQPRSYQTPPQRFHAGPVRRRSHPTEPPRGPTGSRSEAGGGAPRCGPLPRDDRRKADRRADIR